ncbi:glycosyl hydrolase family 79 C-terminal domain-containing protein [Anthocerotibacter panamensis]|uniref:glycosyl hydrolase family 79 C-terminal domain-containing protein n=1 Tax=Anthocerotibacter panamensis TaxID=2857077 RepID=UPI001C403B0E|nr:glycosyl hydrolase family 79 C-terminal domain-containing protein [Anthocerotibacter panamensis]
MRRRTALELALASALLPAWGAPLSEDAPLPEAVDLKFARVGRGTKVAQDFLGLSFEYSDLVAYLGRKNQEFNPGLVQLLKNLGPGTLRVGGASTDGTCWGLVPGPGGRPGCFFTLVPFLVRKLGALAQQTGWRLIAGINLAQNDPEVAQELVQGFLAGIPRAQILAFELGNEPDLYARRPFYALKDPVTGVRTSILTRPQDYSFKAYVHEFAEIQTALARQDPHLPLAGPAFTSRPWEDQLPDFLTALAPKLVLVTDHQYALSRCAGGIPGSFTFPTLDNLLSEKVIEFWVGRAATLVQQAQAQGLKLQVTEFNSVSCGGQAGVSDGLASALWVIDHLLALAQVGVRGVNIHTVSTSPYAPFKASLDGATPQIMPLYAGLLFCALALKGGRIQAVPTPSSRIKAYAIYDPVAPLRVVVLNKDLQHEVQVTLPRFTRSCRLLRLRGDAPDRAGVTLGGQSLQAEVFEPTEETLQPVQGKYRFPVPALSAVLVDLHT